MTSTAAVVVVGSGIVGASIAYQLARHGVSPVIAVDKGRGPAEGSTGSSSSICRCRYSNPQLIRLALDGREAYGNWGAFTELTETRSQLHRVGVLWMLGASRAESEADAGRLASQEVEVEVLDPAGLAERFPALSPCGEPVDPFGDHTCRPAEAFVFETRSGYADPVSANQDLVEAARRSGAEVRFGAPVTVVRRQGSRVVGVELADGSRIDAGLVINAAGPWCNQLNEMAGAELRWTFTPTRAQIVYRTWPPDLGPIPVTGDLSTGIYFRPESGGAQVLVGSVLPEDEEEVVDDPDDFKRVPDAEFTQMKLAALHHRIPALEARGIPTGVAGLYTINRQDVHPVVGPVGIDGYWVANGFSGHGFKLAPAVGSMVAVELSGRHMDFDTEVPMSLFSADRDPIDVASKSVLA